MTVFSDWECIKCVWRPGSFRNRWGAYSAPSDSLVEFRGKGHGKREWKGKREGKGREGEWEGREEGERGGKKGWDGKEEDRGGSKGWPGGYAPCERCPPVRAVPPCRPLMKLVAR